MKPTEPGRAGPRRNQWPTRLVIVAVACGLAACAASAPVEYLTLTALDRPGAGEAPEQPAGTYDGPPIGVRSVHVPPALDRIEIPQWSSSGRFVVNDDRHWAAPLNRLAVQTLTDDLARQLPPASVLAPRLPWPRPHAEVAVDIESLTLTPRGAEVRFSWQRCVTAAQGSAACEADASSGAVGEPRSMTAVVSLAAADDAGRTAQAVSEVLAIVATRIRSDSLRRRWHFEPGTT